MPRRPWGGSHGAAFKAASFARGRLPPWHHVVARRVLGLLRLAWAHRPSEATLSVASRCVVDACFLVAVEIRVRRSFERSSATHVGMVRLLARPMVEMIPDS